MQQTASGRPEGSQPIQLYSLATPNGQKISIALEEMELPYDAHTVDIRKNVQFEKWFVEEVNPNSKIPAIIDKEGPEGPIAIMESAAILLYLGKKTGKFLGSTPRKQVEVLKWLTWQVAGFGPMLGQMGHFWKYAPEDVPYAKARYLKEAQRLHQVLEKQLEGKEYVIGDEYTIADMAIYPWWICVDRGYGRKADMGELPNIERWARTIAARPAVQRGMVVCPWPPS
jgi:GST-like protein